MNSVVFLWHLAYLALKKIHAVSSVALSRIQVFCALFPNKKYGWRSKHKFFFACHFDSQICLSSISRLIKAHKGSSPAKIWEKFILTVQTLFSFQKKISVWAVFRFTKDISRFVSLFKPAGLFWCLAPCAGPCLRLRLTPENGVLPNISPPPNGKENRKRKKIEVPSKNLANSDSSKKCHVSSSFHIT